MTLKSFAFFRSLTHLEKDKEANRYLGGGLGGVLGQGRCQEIQSGGLELIALLD